MDEELVGIIERNNDDRSLGWEELTVEQKLNRLSSICSLQQKLINKLNAYVQPDKKSGYDVVNLEPTLGWLIKYTGQY